MQLLCPVSGRIPVVGLRITERNWKSCGPYILISPEQKPCGQKHRPYEQWLRQAHIRFIQGGRIRQGRKRRQRDVGKLKNVPDRWNFQYKKIFKLRLGLTAFKHVRGVPGASSQLGFYLP
jgi:hypothetical protein